MIRQLAALLFLALLPAAAARAQGCAALKDPGAVEAAIRGPADRSAVQSGLRVVFGADDGFLRDGIIGPVTLSFLEQLCTDVPLAAGTDPVAGTLDLARGYAGLSRAAPAWPAGAAAPGLLAASDAPFRRDVLRLAGSPTTAAVALGAAAAPADCAAVGDVAIAAGDLAPLQAGLAALVAADPDLGPPLATLAEPSAGPATRAALARVCAAYPPAGSAAVLADDMARLGAVVAAVPDAAGILGDPAFAGWLAERQVVRVTRLLGTPPAVVALLEEYRAGAAAAPAAEPEVAAGCPAPAADTPTYYALDAADLEALAARAGLAAALAPVAAERFEDREDLVAAINKVLGVSAPDCAALLADAAVSRHADVSAVYSLDADKLQDLALRPQLGDLIPAVAPLQDIESDDRDRLAAGLEAAIRATVDKALAAAAGLAADAAAAAAEDVSPAPDTPAPGIPPAEPPAERPQEFAITDTSLLLLKPEVHDPDFYAAISASPYHPLPSRELVRSDMLAALEPVVAGRSEDLARAGLAEILPKVRPRWRLTEPVTSELSADPAFAAVPADVLAALAGLSGIAYPNQRLFDRALATLPASVGDSVRSAILDVARKRVENPYARRAVAPIAADCGCNVERRANSLVYGFYPFWRFASADPEAAPRVDFELVGRIAFDGLAIGRDGEMRFAPQWNDAAATFTVSAHRHQAAVDLAIRLEGWRDWDADQTRAAANHVIDALTRQTPVEQVVASNGPLGEFDAWLDRRPDGVTLIADGYTGGDGGRADNLVTLVRMVAAGIDGKRQTINLGFDIPLDNPRSVEQPLFRDLRGLIVNLDDPDARLVKHILVFLERGTSRAKKLLRVRVEDSFHGEERIQVLRSIVPVVPPGANAGLDQTNRAGDETTTEASSYGQFKDDLLYFQDNFAGIGFWPAPDAGATLADGSPDRLADIVAARYYTWTPPLIPAALRAPLRDGVDNACTIVCPNRLAFHLVSAGTAGVIGALLLLGLYSGRVRALSRRLLLVPILMVALLALLVVTVTCDASSLTWAPGVILAMLLLMAGSVIFHWYERRLDGPMP